MIAQQPTFSGNILTRYASESGTCVRNACTIVKELRVQRIVGWQPGLVQVSHTWQLVAHSWGTSVSCDEQVVRLRSGAGAWDIAWTCILFCRKDKI